MCFVCGSRFLHPSSLSGHVWQRDKCTLCDSVVCQQTRGRGVSQATRMSWPSSMSPPPKVSSPISLSFTSLPPSLRFVPPCLMSRSHLAALPCYWPTLLPSVLRNFRYSDILGIISAQTSEWERMTPSSGVLSRVQDHQEMPRVPGDSPD